MQPQPSLLLQATIEIAMCCCCCCCLCASRMHADALAGRHFGELSCREFRESLLAVLPQQWTR
jgi:hypothetical protein